MLSAIVGGASALLGASASKDAARSHERAANAQAEVSRDIYEDQKKLSAPYLESGTNALDAFAYNLGISPQPTFGGTRPEITTEQYITGYSDRNPTSGYHSDRAERSSLNKIFGGSVQGGDPEYGTRYNVGGQTFYSLEEAEAWARANPVGGTPYEKIKQPGTLADYGYQDIRFDTAEGQRNLMDEFVESPGYQFRFDEGMQAVEAGVAGRQGANSGAAMEALTRYGQGIASDEWNQYYNRRLGERDFGLNFARGERAYDTGERDSQMNRLFALSGLGQGAVSQQSNAASQYGGNVNNALANVGNAQAAGSVGTYNALSRGLEDGLSTWKYLNAA